MEIVQSASRSILWMSEHLMMHTGTNWMGLRVCSFFSLQVIKKIQNGIQISQFKSQSLIPVRNLKTVPIDVSFQSKF